MIKNIYNYRDIMQKKWKDYYNETFILMLVMPNDKVFIKFYQKKIILIAHPFVGGFNKKEVKTNELRLNIN